MAEYEIYTKGDLQAVQNISVFTDPNCIKYTIVGTLDKDDDDIKRRVQILDRIMEKNWDFLLDAYLELNPESPLLEEKVHVDLLIALMDKRVNYELTGEHPHNLLTVALKSGMDESQFHSLSSYLINDHKAYHLFSKKMSTDCDEAKEGKDHYHFGDWICPVVHMLWSKTFVYLETLKMIFNIPGFDINQTVSLEIDNYQNFTLFQIANMLQKGVSVYKLMVEMGADYKKEYPDLKSPLELAVGHNDFEAVDFYMSLGFSVHHKDSKGNTPVMFADQSLEMIKYLQSKGADISLINNDGYSVFHFCAKVAECDQFGESVMYFSEHASELLNRNARGIFSPLELRKTHHPDDLKGIELLEQVMATIERTFPFFPTLEDYKIYTNGDLKAIQSISDFTDPNCIKYTIVDTLDKDDEEIKGRVQILNRIIDTNPFILNSYRQLDPESPLLEEKVHVVLLLALIRKGANFQPSDPSLRNVVTVAVESNMNESQLYSLSTFLINDYKAYHLFSKNNCLSCDQENENNSSNDPSNFNPDHYHYNGWTSPVASMLFSEHFVYLDTLKMILNIAGFNINQTARAKISGESCSLTLLQLAASQNKGVAVYKLMVESGADYKINFPYATTYLKLAVRSRDFKAVDYFISLGFSVHEKYLHGNALIMQACRCVKMIDYLKSKGVDISVESDIGYSIFHYCALCAKADEFGEAVIYFSENAPELLSKKTFEGYTPLDLRRLRHSEDQEGIGLLKQMVIMKSTDKTIPKMDPKCIKYTILGTLDDDRDIIKQKVRKVYKIMDLCPEILETYNQLDTLRATPVLENFLHVDLLKALIDNGANFRSSVNGHGNLVGVAAQSNMSESQFHSLCSYLIKDHKAYDLFSKKTNLNPDEICKDTWFSPVIAVLLSTDYLYLDSLKMIFNIPGFDINQTHQMNLESAGGMCDLTLFQIANELHRGVEVYKLMIENGADYKRKSLHGRTNLMLAVLHSDVNAVEFYISLGFSVHDEDFDGGTTIMCACRDLKMIEYVKSLGGYLYQIDKQGNSVFHYSAELVKPDSFGEFVMYFGEHAPNLLNKMNKEGETPLDIRKKEHPEDLEGIALLELVMASIKERNDRSICKIS